MIVKFNVSFVSNVVAHFYRRLLLLGHLRLFLCPHLIVDVDVAVTFPDLLLDWDSDRAKHRAAGEFAAFVSFERVSVVVAVVVVDPFAF